MISRDHQESETGRGLLLLCNVSAIIPFTTKHEHAPTFQICPVSVAFNQLCKRRVALHKHGLVNGDIKVFTQVCHSSRFGLAAAVRKEDERDAVGLEVAKGLGSARQRLGAAQEDAINAGES